MSGRRNFIRLEVHHEYRQELGRMKFLRMWAVPAHAL